MKYDPDRCDHRVVDDGITDLNDVARFVGLAAYKYGCNLTPEMAVQQFNDLMAEHDRKLIEQVEKVHHGRIGRV